MQGSRDSHTLQLSCAQRVREDNLQQSSRLQEVACDHLSISWVFSNLRSQDYPFQHWQVQGQARERGETEYCFSLYKVQSNFRMKFEIFHRQNFFLKDLMSYMVFI